MCAVHATACIKGLGLCGPLQRLTVFSLSHVQQQQQYAFGKETPLLEKTGLGGDVHIRVLSCTCCDIYRGWASHNVLKTRKLHRIRQPRELHTESIKPAVRSSTIWYNSLLQMLSFWEQKCFIHLDYCKMVVIMITINSVVYMFSIYPGPRPINHATLYIVLYFVAQSTRPEQHSSQ